MAQMIVVPHKIHFSNVLKFPIATSHQLLTSIRFGRNRISNQHCRLIQLALNVIIKETNVRGVKMSEKNPFEIVDGQVILHDEFQGINKTILNYEQVAAIKLLIQKCICKDRGQNQSN